MDAVSHDACCTAAPSCRGLFISTPPYAADGPAGCTTRRGRPPRRGLEVTAQLVARRGGLGRSRARDHFGRTTNGTVLIRFMKGCPPCDIARGDQA